MGYKAYVDDQMGLRGRIVVLNPKDKSDREIVFKHPFLLRLRCWLAMWRIVRRERKLAKFNARHA
jgi:hypothetical protein